LAGNCRLAVNYNTGLNRKCTRPEQESQRWNVTFSEQYCTLAVVMYCMSAVCQQEDTIRTHKLSTAVIYLVSQAL